MHPSYRPLMRGRESCPMMITVKIRVYSLCWIFSQFLWEHATRIKLKLDQANCLLLVPFKSCHKGHKIFPGKSDTVVNKITSQDTCRNLWGSHIRLLIWFWRIILNATSTWTLVIISLYHNLVGECFLVTHPDLNRAFHGTSPNSVAVC